MFSRIVRSTPSVQQSSVQQSRRNLRCRLRKWLAIEVLERRELLAADYLYSLEARAGAPDIGFGVSHVANSQFHIVANVRYPDLNQPNFFGEIQVHNASTGSLVRTIQSPLPFADGLGKVPNYFGYSVDIVDNLILVGSPGAEGRFLASANTSNTGTGGRAFLFDANTGNLLRTFDGSFVSKNDVFGRSVAIDGNKIVIGAHGPSYEDPELQNDDTDPGRVYVYDAGTGNLLNIITSPDPSPSVQADFGANVSLSNGKLVVTQGGYDLQPVPVGPTRVYDAQSGNPLQTLAANGSRSFIEGNDILVGVDPGTTQFFNATTGANTQTRSAHLYGFDGNLIVTGPTSGDPTALPVIRDFPSWNVLYAVPSPPNFVETYFEFEKIPKVFGDRLLVPGVKGPVLSPVVFVYSVTDGEPNSPPTDIALSNNSVPENSANGTVIGTLSATDPTPGETLTYSLLNSAGGRFSISGIQLRVNNGSLLDFETNTSHSVTVQVTDSAGNTFGKVLSIQVTNVNEPPTDIGLSNDSVAENSPNGTLVGTLSATDPDVPETFTFSLLDSAGGRFSIVGNQLRVNNGSLLDFETITSHNITMQVADSNGITYVEVLTIQVTNANESPSDIALSNNTVPESTVRMIHSSSGADPALFGKNIAAGGNRLLVQEQFGVFPAVEDRVQVIDATTGERLRTLAAPTLNPTAIDPDGSFGIGLAIAGNRAFVGANATKVGNVENVGIVFVFDMDTGNLLLTLNSPAPVLNGYFGSNVAISGNVLAVSASGEGFGRIYLFNATNGQLLETVLNPTSTPLELFGQYLAMSGNTLVTSSRFADVGATDAGVAYIYELNPATSIASLTHTLNNPTPAPDERFGGAVAVAGNFVAVFDSTAVAGAANVGSVHLFDRVTGAFLRTIANPAPGATDQFGSDLIISGDLVIASSLSDLGGFNNGRAYVFQASTGALIATIQNPSPADGDEFAFRIAVTGSRIVASATGDDADGNQRGLVYVFDLPIGQPIGTLSTTDPDAGETFTYSLIDSAGGRFAIDGNKLVIADASKLDYETATTHNVTVIVADSSGSQFAKIFPITVTAVNEPPQDISLSGGSVTEGQVRFLHNPAIQKNLVYGNKTDADGDLVVVATNKLTGGEAYVLNAQTGALVSTLVSPTPQDSEIFGENIAVAGNLVVVAARLKDLAASNVGQVYVFNATTGALVHTLNHPAPASNVEFGSSVAINGNLIGVTSQGSLFLFNASTGGLLQTINLPSSSRVSISGNTIATGYFTGAVQVYEFNPTTQLATATVLLSNPAPTPLDSFGGTVAVHGNVIAVSAFQSNIGANKSGRVYLFDRVTGNLLRTILNPLNAPNDIFGVGIAIHGSILAVSAALDANAVMTSGRISLFDVSSGNLLRTVANPMPNNGDQFLRVSLAGTRLVVGDAFDDTDGNNTGMVYVIDLLLGQVAGTLATYDPDVGDSISYTLVDNAGGRFALQGNTLVVANASMLDASINPSHKVILRAMDSTGLFTTEQLTIQVIPGPQPPRDITFTGNTVVEQAANLTLVSTLSTADPNAGDSFTYSLIDSAGGRFGIVGNTVVVNNGVAIDFETNPEHLILVRVTDSSGLSTYESFRIIVLDAPEALDFGDLPNSFGTTLVANGARHMLSNSLRLGATVSSEANGQPSANANLDTGDDGVTLPFLLVPGLNATTTIVSSQSGRLDAFIDFNGNGSFAESERITPVGGLLLTAGVNTFSFAVPSSANAGNQGVRFRVSTLGGLSPIGAANDGEVEDYRISIVVPNPLSSQILADPEFPGLSMLYVRGSTNDDIIAINQNAGGLRATINGVQGAVLVPTSRVVIFGLSGDDDLRINGTTMPGYIDGGPDDDIIRGGNGPDLLFGRGGDDTIYGRNGDDTIYGGSGDDTLESNGGIGYLFGEGNSDTLTGNGILVGGNGSDELNGTGVRNVLIGGNGGDLLTGANANQGDIIVAGITSYDSDLVALKAIRDEWRDPTPVNSRIAHLDGSTPGGLNVPYYLNVNSVFLDNASDTIVNFGSNNPTRNDWIFRSPNDIKLNPPGIVVTITNSPPAMFSSRATVSGEQETVLNNLDQPSDADGDGITTPLDVLLVINYLNTLSQPTEDSSSTVPAFLDTDGDGTISPLDALLVINRLNRSSRFVPDDIPEEEFQEGSVDDVFKLLAEAEGEADLNNLWGGADTELEWSILDFGFGARKRRSR